MQDIIQFIGSGPIPNMLKLISFSIPDSFGEECSIRFRGWYRVLDRMEPSGTELDEYERPYMLPQSLQMVHITNKNTIVYIIEIYRRYINTATYDVDSEDGVDQTIYFRIIRALQMI